MPNKRAFYSSTRASSLSGVVVVNSRELAATVTQPLPVKAPDGTALTGVMTRLHCEAMGEASNSVAMPGGQQYVIPPNVKNITDTSFPAITSEYTNEKKASIPNVANYQCPVFFYDGGHTDGKDDRLYMQPGTYFLNCSPQSGQLSKLSKFAKQYDQYQIVALKLNYVPTCATNTDGIIVISIDSNVTTFPNITKSKMLQQKHCVTGSLYSALTLVYVNPDKSWKWCTSPAGRVYPQGENANRDPDRFSDSFYAYMRVFDSQKATLTNDGSSLSSFSTYGYLYVEYQVRFKNPSNNNSLIADKDDVDMESVTLTETVMLDGMAVPPLGLAPMGLLARSSKVPLTSVSSNDKNLEEDDGDLTDPDMPDLEEVDCEDSESCDTCSEDEDEEIAKCLDSLHGAKGKSDREAAWEDLMQAYDKRLNTAKTSCEPVKPVISPLLSCVKEENEKASLF